MTIETLKLPDFWNLNKSDIHTKCEVTIDRNSNEFLLVNNKLKQFLLESKSTITNLFRLQNYSLLEKYKL